MDPVSAIAGALGSFFRLVSPSIDEKYAQAYDDEKRSSIDEFGKILERPDSDDRARTLSSFCSQLLINSGRSPGDISSGAIRIPLSHFSAFVETVAEDIALQKKLAKIEFKSNNP